MKRRRFSKKMQTRRDETHAQLRAEVEADRAGVTPIEDATHEGLVDMGPLQEALHAELSKPGRRDDQHYWLRD
jgi:deoxyxylulose-5-phosphate synthase